MNGALSRPFRSHLADRIVTALDRGGVEATICLNKRDLVSAEECERQRRELCELDTAGIPLLRTSILTGEGIEELRALLSGRAAVLVGHSGVGKSSLLNALAPEADLRTGAVRDLDGKGRHTTAWRELMLLPGGGLIIDTPGLRDVQVWGDVEALRGSFADIETIAEGCRFRDCEHAEEPGCAVRQAVEDGRVAETRVANYRKMRRELGALGERRSRREDIIENVRWKRMSQWSRKKKKNRRRFETDE